MNPTEILERWCAQFSENPLSRTRLFTWHKEFPREREEIQNLSHDRRLRTSITLENMEVVRRPIEIVEEVNNGSVQKIMIDDLEFRKVCARWVPHLFSDDGKRH